MQAMPEQTPVLTFCRALFCRWLPLLTRRRLISWRRGPETPGSQRRTRSARTTTGPQRLPVQTMTSCCELLYKDTYNMTGVTVSRGFLQLGHLFPLLDIFLSTTLLELLGVSSITRCCPLVSVESVFFFFFFFGFLFVCLFFAPNSA